MRLAGKKALVVGLGESGLAMAKWLSRQGVRVQVTDTRDQAPHVSELSAVAPDADLIAWSHVSEALSQVDFIALSPGVPPATPELASATAPLISEVELFALGLFDYAPLSKIIAITGSNGKTTTTALCAHLLNSAGVAATACGNISPSALDALMEALDQEKLPSIWVLELSSFQLETTYSLKAHAATLLNICDDHLDRYEGSLGLYAQIKGRVFDGGGVMVLNRDDDHSLANGRCGRRMLTFGLDAPSRAVDFGLREKTIYRGQEALVDLKSLPIAGLHNAANVMAALALCEAVGVAVARVLPALSTFKGLPHRVETVAEIRGVRYIDDSKGTNVGATLAAIAGLGAPVAIILGGEGKGQDFSPLKAVLTRHGRAVALIGRDAARIEQAIAGCNLPTRRCADMDDAVRWLAEQAQPGDCVLLSPACASLDMYRNYAHRAAAFVATVEALST